MGPLPMGSPAMTDIVRRLRTALLGAAALLAAPPLASVPLGAAPVRPGDAALEQRPPAERTDASALTLESGTGRVVGLSGPAANVFVADPKVAEVRPASASSLFVFGVAPGHTTVAALDSAGHVLAQYDVTVQPTAFNAHQAQATIGRLITGSRVQVQSQAKGLLLTGSVPSPADAAQAAAIARGYLAGDGQLVDNELRIDSPIQVTLQVRIAQVSRQVVRQLGIDWNALGTIGKFGFAFTTPTSVVSQIAGGAGAAVVTGPPTDPNRLSASAILNALAQDNLAKVLAEPNLTVMSGESASFQVGGEYPIPVSQQNNQVTVAYKNYGVMLSFVPTVYNDGRINLHVKPEVSEISNQNAFSLSSGSSNASTSLVVPSLIVRRAETTVELGSGQSFAIAGLLQQQGTDSSNRIPGLGDTPVIGALFGSNAFSNTETELVIIVTPYVVRPVNDPSKLHLPTDGFTHAPDLERLLLMRQAAHNAPAVPVRVPGDAGFVVQ